MEGPRAHHRRLPAVLHAQHRLHPQPGLAHRRPGRRVLRLRRPRDHAARGARPAGGHVHARRRGHLLRPALHHHQPLRPHGIPPGRPGDRDGERQRYHLGRHRAGRRADPRRRPPHHHALRPPNHRRLRQDRHRLQRRPAQAGAVHAGPHHPLRPRHHPAGAGPVPPGSAPHGGARQDGQAPLLRRHIAAKDGAKADAHLGSAGPRARPAARSCGSN